MIVFKFILRLSNLFICILSCSKAEFMINCFGYIWNYYLLSEFKFLFFLVKYEMFEISVWWNTPDVFAWVAYISIKKIIINIFYFFEKYWTTGVNIQVMIFFHTKTKNTPSMDLNLLYKFI